MRSRSVLPAPGVSRLLVMYPPKSRLLRALPATYVDWLGIERQLRLVELRWGRKAHRRAAGGGRAGMHMVPLVAVTSGHSNRARFLKKRVGSLPLTIVTSRMRYRRRMLDGAPEDWLTLMIALAFVA